jgi:hypothetical protein
MDIGSADHRMRGMAMKLTGIIGVVVIAHVDSCCFPYKGQDHD